MYLFEDSFFIVVSVGLNCALGAKAMRPHIQSIARVAECYTICYPNAGLPDEMGGYKQTPKQMAEEIEDFLQNGFANIIGGCCGTTPDFIKEIAKVAAKYKPRTPKPKNHNLRLSGLEPFEYTDRTLFLNIGERCNVMGSIQFRKLIAAGKYEVSIQI